MSNKTLKESRKGYLTAKLSIFDWGWAENILFKLKAKQSEKNKGLIMIQKLKELFGISNHDIQLHERKIINDEVRKITFTRDVFTRDERGNIVSPFRSKRKIV